MNRRRLLRVAPLAGTAAIASNVSGAGQEAGANAGPAEAGTPGGPGAPKPLRLLILGGTGFLGPHEVRYALARGHKVTLFNRGRRPKEWPGEVEELAGDRDTGNLKALEGREWDVCIDNPASAPFWVRDAGQLLSGRVGRYIYVSSISALADMSRPGQTEEAPTAEYRGPDVMKETHATLREDLRLFGPLKAACEAEAEKQFPGRAAIIRPSLIAGPGDDTDRFTYWPARIAKGGEVLAPPPDDPVQFIDVRDLAEWIIRLAETGTTGTFHATGPGYELTTAALLFGIRAAGTAPARFTFTTAAFLAEQRIRPWMDLPVWMPGEGETAGFHRLNPARAAAAGLTWRPLAVTAADTLAWFQSLPPERQARPGAGISADREAAALQAWHAARR